MLLQNNIKMAKSSFYFLLYQQKKVLIRPNFRLLVFDGFTRFGMFSLRFDYFWTMFVCLDEYLCVCDKNFCGKCSSKTNALNFMKLFILDYTTINWCLTTFDENLSTGGAVITLFLEFLGHAYLDFYWLKLRKKLCTTYI